VSLLFLFLINKAI